jgi:hypothetical protein
LPSSTNRSQHEEPFLDPSEARADEGAGGGLECPNSNGAWLISESTGAAYPLRCRRLSCPVCCLINARRRSLAIAYARPERALLLTKVGDDWQTGRERLKRFRYDVAKSTGKPFEWLWHIEPNPEGTGHHAHAWQHGSFVDQAEVSRLAVKNGMGEVAMINRIRSAVGASQYGLKGLGYGLKSIEQESAAEYLRANGRRLTHQSRGYFRSETGESIGARASEELALGASRTRDPGPWTVTTL